MYYNNFGLEISIPVKLFLDEQHVDSPKSNRNLSELKTRFLR